jgi:SAM-dependent methyltransferase
VRRLKGSAAALDRVRWSWDAFGRTDPLWAVLTAPGTQGGRWDPGDFFRTGEGDVARLLAVAEEHGLVTSKGAALDFGCGVGRLTQPLAARFERVVGVDVAPSMLDLARARNRYGDRCRYLLNQDPHLGLFPGSTFDLVLSLFVLQHMPPYLSAAYLGELVRVLKPGGTLVFQLPVAPLPGQDAGGEVTEPLPAHAYRADLAVRLAPAHLPPGALVDLGIRLRNASQVAWTRFPGDRALQVGNHWCRATGEQLLLDDGRSPVPRDLAPGEEVDLSLRVRTPSVIGRYRLEVDVVLEGVAWFADRGSSPASLPVRVGSGPTRALSRLPGRLKGRGGSVTLFDGPPPRPIMEMHPVPDQQVRNLVEAAGGLLVHRQPGTIPGFEDCTYFVTKAP